MEKVYILYLSRFPERSLKVFSSKVKLINFLRMQKQTSRLGVLIKKLEGVKSIGVGVVISVPIGDAGEVLKVEARWLNELITYPEGCYS